MFSIGAQYYSHIYIWLIVVLSIFVIGRYGRYSQNHIDKGQNKFSVGVLFLGLFLTLFIGLRPVSGQYFVDMAAYNRSYLIIFGEHFDFDWNTNNKLFDNLFSFFASRKFPPQSFFLFLAALYFLGIAWACAKLFLKDKMAAFLVYLGAFSTYSYGVNGLKAGVAAAFFLMALALYKNKKVFWTVVFLLLSIGFHHSMLLPIIAFVICILIKNPKFFTALWLLCFVLSALHVSYFQNFFSGFGSLDEKLVEYLGEDNEGYIRSDIFGGFRIDFILYSFVPILVGWIAVYKKKIQSNTYRFLLNLYTFINAIWLLCMYASYTNRIAYLSWLMYPIVLIYPFLNERWDANQYKTFKWVAYGHLAFTLFMQYIY